MGRTTKVHFSLIQSKCESILGDPVALARIPPHHVFVRVVVGKHIFKGSHWQGVAESHGGYRLPGSLRMFVQNLASKRLTITSSPWWA